MRRRGVQLDLQRRQTEALLSGEASLRLLAEASAALATSLDYATTLATVVRLSVPAFADNCIVFLLSDTREILALESACVDPSHRDLLDRAARSFLESPDWDNTPVGHVIQSGQSELGTDIGPEWWESFVRSDEQRQLVRTLDLRSYIIAPLIARGRVLGVLALTRSASSHRYDTTDLFLGEEIARRCALALDNAWLYYQATATEAQLRHQFGFTNALTQSIADGIYASDQAGRATFVNLTATRMLGWEADELLGRSTHEMIHFLRADGSPYPEEECPLSHARLTGETVRGDDIFIRKDGSRLPVSYTSAPIVSDGQIVGSVTAFQDISERKSAEEERARLIAEIEQERSMLAATTSSMLDGLILVDQQGRILYFNQHAADLLGVERERIVGQRLDDILTWFQQNVENPEAARVVFQAARANIDQRPSFEVMLREPSHRVVMIQLFPVVDATGARIGGAGLLRDVTAAKLLAVLEERERIAMDLHDGVIQALYGLGLGLGVHERTLDGDPEKTRTLLRQARTQIDDIIQMIRNYIFDLRLRQLGEHGLRAGIEVLAKEMQVNDLVIPEVKLDDDVERLLAPPTITSLLQITREATSNVIRHARASKVTIALRREGQKLVLTIHDNGRGFDPQHHASSHGQGLKNMAERTRALGGCFTVQSAPGQGTTVRLEIPLLKEVERE